MYSFHIITVSNFFLHRYVVSIPINYKLSKICPSHQDWFHRQSFLQSLIGLAGLGPWSTFNVFSRYIHQWNRISFQIHSTVRQDIVTEKNITSHQFTPTPQDCPVPYIEYWHLHVPLPLNVISNIGICTCRRFHSSQVPHFSSKRFSSVWFPISLASSTMLRPLPSLDLRSIPGSSSIARAAPSLPATSWLYQSDLPVGRQNIKGIARMLAIHNIRPFFFFKTLDRL